MSSLLYHQHGRTRNPLTLWTVPVLVGLLCVRVWVWVGVGVGVGGGPILGDPHSVQLSNATTTTTINASPFSVS